MKNEKVIEILQNELQCVKRQINECCDNKRDCPICGLNVDNDEIIVAYAKAIQAVEKFEQEQKINTSLRSELKTAQETITHLRHELDVQKASD